MAKPKLALIPAAQGSDKLFSVLPSSGVGDFDFIRPSSATRINSQGLIEEVATKESRLNYPLIDGKVVGCPHHILEPQRTNLLPYSEDFSVSNWSKYGAGTGVAPTLTSNYAISPDGTLNASRLQLDKGTGTGAGNMSILFDSLTVTSGLTTNKNIYLKSNTSEEYDLVLYGSSDASGTNLKKIRVTSEWQRFDVFKTISATTTGLSVGLREINVTGLSNTADVLIYGAQVEDGSYPTSYIPTNGSAVTRSAETANNSGDASTFNDSEGVLMAEISALANDGTNRRISISDGSASDRILLGYTSSSNQLIALVSSNSVSGVVGTVNIDNSLQFNKIALKYKLNDFALWINGIEVLTDNSLNTPVGLNTLRFEDGNGSNDFYGSTKQLQYHNSALTDSELEELTSWTSFTDMAQGQQYSIK
jgi:hypothetical protein